MVEGIAFLGCSRDLALENGPPIGLPEAGPKVRVGCLSRTATGSKPTLAVEPDAPGRSSEFEVRAATADSRDEPAL